MRIPIWPGLRLSVWEPQNQEAVQVRMPYARPYLPIRRVLSMRGWMLLLIRYDWRKRDYQPSDTEALDRIRAEVVMLCDCCGDNRERMGRIRAELGLDTEGYFPEDDQ